MCVVCISSLSQSYQTKNVWSSEMRALYVYQSSIGLNSIHVLEKEGWSKESLK